MIIDTGPLVLLLTEKSDNRYKKCATIFETLQGDLITTYPCLTEAMHLLEVWHYRDRLWKWILNSSIRVYDLSETDLKRMKILMEKFKDTPMDFADASLVALAEAINLNQIFTLDSDFDVYRYRDKIPFEIIP
ncbi:MAG: type II toxin-antitoxin system VapC family toxin [Pyrinomonadaceae bacterium]